MDKSENHYPLIIMGAGPAGLMAAVSANTPTLVIEKGPKAGRKLLITAAGQCNLTHQGTPAELLARYNKKERFLRTALYGYSNKELMEFFESRGVPLFYDEKGRCLPRSLRAQDILGTLLSSCGERNVDFDYNNGVISVGRIDDSQMANFSVKTEEQVYTCDKLIISTGGKSFPKTGSNGEGYAFAQAMGHTIVPLKPALTGVIAKEYHLTSLSGLSFDNICLDLYRQKKIASYQGDLLLTHKGISGPVIINNTRDMEKGDVLKINFINQSQEEITQELQRTASQEGKKSVGAFLKGFNLPKKFIPILFSEAEKSLAQLKKEERKVLIESLTAYSFTIGELQGFNTAMVTAGGVETKEVNPKTMESRLIPHLFFAGEVLDIDGDSGGYNLQAAFSTGHLAGVSSSKAD